MCIRDRAWGPKEDECKSTAIAAGSYTTESFKNDSSCKVLRQRLKDCNAACTNHAVWRITSLHALLPNNSSTQK
eukprot:2436786-Amphidinium_carterae.1